MAALIYLKYVWSFQPLDKSVSDLPVGVRLLIPNRYSRVTYSISPDKLPIFTIFNLAFNNRQSHNRWQKEDIALNPPIEMKLNWTINIL